MNEQEFQELILDMKAHGQRDPITLFEDMVLDGVHRYRACLELDLKPNTQNLDDGVDPIAYVKSKNLHRRHMTETQRGAAIALCAEWAQSGGNRHTSGGDPGHPLTVKEMADAAQTSPRTIQRIKKGIDAGLGEDMRDGKVTAKKAARLAKQVEEERQPVIEAPSAPEAEPTPEALMETSKLSHGFETPPPVLTPVSELTEDGASQEARIKVFEEENTELKRKLEEADSQVQALHEENESLHRILDTEDRMGAYEKEVAAAAARARKAEAENKSLRSRVQYLQHYNKDYIKQIKKLEKKLKAESEPQPTEVAI